MSSESNPPRRLADDEKPNLTPEQIERVMKMLRRPKMLHVEVSRRTFDAVKANPGDLKLIAKDEHGNPVVERPHRPRTGTISEDDLIKQLGAEKGRAEYERIRAESRRYQPNLDLAGVSRFGEPQDQYWALRRDRHSGEVRYVPDDGLRNEYVVSDYDIFAVLRRD
jgi:hypothetical protein